MKLPSTSVSIDVAEVPQKITTDVNPVLIIDRMSPSKVSLAKSPKKTVEATSKSSTPQRHSKTTKNSTPQRKSSKTPDKAKLSKKKASDSIDLTGSDTPIISCWSVTTPAQNGSNSVIQTKPIDVDLTGDTPTKSKKTRSKVVTPSKAPASKKTTEAAKSPSSSKKKEKSEKKNGKSDKNPSSIKKDKAESIKVTRLPDGIAGVEMVTPSSGTMSVTLGTGVLNSRGALITHKAAVPHKLSLINGQAHLSPDKLPPKKVCMLFHRD